MTFPACRTSRVAAFGVGVLLSTWLAQAAFGAASCPAPFARPERAKKISSSLVPAFVQCDSIFVGNAPNATTETGTVPSCYPAVTYHELAGNPPDGWLWGPKARGSVSFKADVNRLVPPEHPLNTDPAARDLAISVAMKDVRTSDSGAPSGIHGFAVVLVRATLIDRDEPSMPMTILDIPLTFEVPVFRGTIARKTSLTALLNGLMQPAFPPCTSLELLAFQVKDPNFNPFATMGAYLP
jgi:hypothetical protein